jgi:hypothetical protein
MRLPIINTFAMLVMGVSTLAALTAAFATPGARILAPTEMLHIRGGHVADCYKMDNLACEPAFPDPCTVNECEWVPVGMGGYFECQSREDRQNALTFPGCVEYSGPAGGGRRECVWDPNDKPNKTRCVAVYSCSGCVLVNMVMKCQTAGAFLCYKYLHDYEYLAGPACP